MLRVKPLMIACTADDNPDVVKQAKLVGFDQVILSPLTEKKVNELILPEIKRRYKLA